LYLQLKEIVAEILAAETDPGDQLEGFLIRTEFDDYKPAYSFIWIEESTEPSVNFENSGNNWSLMLTQLLLTIYKAKTPGMNMSVDEHKAEAQDYGWIVRRILKNNPRLISASAPAPGYAVRSAPAAVTYAYFKLDDGVERSVSRILFKVWHMKSEAA
jgi:hypothetical protein